MTSRRHCSPPLYPPAGHTPSGSRPPPASSPRPWTPDNADRIEAAAWLHDIGYAPTLVHTGFHPIDGAAYLQRTAPTLLEIASLVAHHTGAHLEARQRGLAAELARYPYPTAGFDLALLNCADLCTGPHGDPVDPDARLTEVLHRYPPGHPVHQAITMSGPLLCAQAHLVLEVATNTAQSVAQHPHCAPLTGGPFTVAHHRTQGPTSTPRS